LEEKDFKNKKIKKHKKTRDTRIQINQRAKKTRAQKVNIIIKINEFTKKQTK
jgi:hypothetical protein